VNKLSIIENSCTLLYQNGFQMLSNTCVLVGMSPGNGYFSEENMISILAGISRLAPKVAILVPDLPHIHNFLGMGYDSKVAQKKARKDTSQTNNRLKRVFDVLTNDLGINNLEIFNWETQVEFNTDYQKKLSIIYDEYESNPEFHLCVNTVIHNYLQSKIKDKTVKHDNIAHAVHYYLKELALFTAPKSVFKEHSLVVAYYQIWGDGLQYLEKRFPGFSKNVGMIQYALSEAG
jgi:cyclo(L-tyrosyl-L-tyrosyl) synthase